MTMDWGDTVALLFLISPLIIVLLALVIGAIALAFAAGAGILAGIMNLITRPIQSILWVIKWLLLIAASFAALWGFIWLFFPGHVFTVGLFLRGRFSLVLPAHRAKRDVTGSNRKPLSVRSIVRSGVSLNKLLASMRTL